MSVERSVYVSVVESCYVHTNIYTLSLLKINAVHSERTFLFLLCLYTEKRVGPRIEPCGTPIETPRGPDNSPFDTLSFIREVVGEPGEAVILETKAVESADKNVVIDRVESLGQVDDDGCTVMPLIYGGYDIV